MMGRWHAFYAAQAGAELTAIGDREERNAAALRGRYPRAGSFNDLGECLARREVDIVHVCTPPSSHASLAAAALAGGTHALVEKPLALSVADTERLIELARRSELRLNPTHQFPFQRGVQRLSRDLGSLGEPVRLTFVTCTAGGAGLAGCRPAGPAGRSDRQIVQRQHPVRARRQGLPGAYRGQLRARTYRRADPRGLRPEMTIK